MFESLCSDNSFLSGTEGFGKKQVGGHFVDGGVVVKGEKLHPSGIHNNQGWIVWPWKNYPCILIFVYFVVVNFVFVYLYVCTFVYLIDNVQGLD